MKKLLLILPIVLPALILGLMSCTSSSPSKDVTPPCDASTCATPSAAPTASDSAPAVSTDQVLSEQDWSLSVPQGWAKMSAPIDDANIKVFMGNQDKKNLVIFVKEAFLGSSAEYALEGLRGLKDGGNKISTARQVDLNGNKFVLLDSSRDNLRMWMWVTAKNGFGYAFSCGGPVDDTGDQENTCTQIANTLTIK